MRDPVDTAGLEVTVGMRPIYRESPGESRSELSAGWAGRQVERGHRERTDRKVRTDLSCLAIDQTSGERAQQR